MTSFQRKRSRKQQCSCSSASSEEERSRTRCLKERRSASTSSTNFVQQKDLQKQQPLSKRRGISTSCERKHLKVFWSLSKVASSLQHWISCLRNFSDFSRSVVSLQWS